MCCILLSPLHTAFSKTELTPAAFCARLDYKIPHCVLCWASQARGAAHVIARPSLDVVCELFCCQGWACAEELGAILGKNLSWFWSAVDLRVRKVLMVELSEIYWPKSLLRAAGAFLGWPWQVLQVTQGSTAGWIPVLQGDLASQAQSSSITFLHCKLCFMDLTVPLHCSCSLYGSQPSKATSNHYFHLNWCYCRPEVNQVLIEFISLYTQTHGRRQEGYFAF